MAGYSSRGTHKAYCDRCGFPYQGFELSPEGVGTGGRATRTRLLVCEDCRDEPDVRRPVRPDNYVVRDPRPGDAPDWEGSPEESGPMNWEPY